MEKNVSFSFTLIQKVQEISKTNETDYEVKDRMKRVGNSCGRFREVIRKDNYCNRINPTLFFFFLSSCSFTCLGALNTQPDSHTQDRKCNARCYKFVLFISVLIIQVESRFILSLLQLGLSGTIFICFLCVLKLNHLLFVKSFIKSSLVIITPFTFLYSFFF